MRIQATAAGSAAGRSGLTPQLGRRALVIATAMALAASVVVASRSDSAGIDPDLVRVLRFMAAMKGAFAAAAFFACYWRLARPATFWRNAVYVAGAPLMIVGAAGMWSMHHPGAAALGLHLGLFAVLAAALTDPDFLPRLAFRNGRRP